MFADVILKRSTNLPWPLPKEVLRICICLLVCGGAFLAAIDVQAATSIQFTAVPPYGSQNNLLGKVYGVNSASNRVAVYIYIDGIGWFTKPTCASPLTTIQADGSWNADITTGGVDSNATRIAAFVVPANFSQPCVTNEFCLPDAVQQQAIANATVTRVDPATRSFHWSGYDWWVKTSASPVGPGPNYFSGTTNNVSIDAQGRLHLRVTHTSNAWQCAEIVSQRTLGYGRYAYHLATPVDTLDPDIVLGLFTWHDENDNANNEMDVECGRWVSAVDYANAQFVRQPYYLPGQLVRYRIPTLATNAIPSYDWEPGKIGFLCTTGTTATATLGTNLLLNPSFESGSGQTANNWTQFGDAYRTASNIFSAFTALSSSNSMKVYGPFNAGLDEAGAYQNISGASPGQVWQLSGFGFNWSGDAMTNTAAYGMAQLVFLDATSNPIQVNQSQHFDSNTPLNQWQYFQVTGTAPAGTVAVQARVSHFGKAGIAGSVWWDELSLNLNPDLTAIAHWNYSNSVPTTCDENVRLNFWLINGNPPLNGQEAEVIVDRFEFIPADTDGDSMPDAWEQAHGLNLSNPTDANHDDDGDGFTNLQEYLAGTDPADPASRLNIAAWIIVGTDAHLSFSTQLDKTYVLEGANSLQPPNWTSVIQNVAGTGGNVPVVDFGGATNIATHFYRVRLMQ